MKVRLQRTLNVIFQFVAGSRKCNKMCFDEMLITSLPKAFVGHRYPSSFYSMLMLEQSQEPMTTSRATTLSTA